MRDGKALAAVWSLVFIAALAAAGCGGTRRRRILGDVRR